MLNEENARSIPPEAYMEDFAAQTKPVDYHISPKSIQWSQFAAALDSLELLERFAVPLTHAAYHFHDL